MDDPHDPEIAALNAEFAGRWHVTRLPDGGLDAAAEPDRAQHVTCGDAARLAARLREGAPGYARG